MPALTPVQRQVLRALVDTAVPALQVDDDPTGFWATPGSAAGADEALAQYLETLPEADQTGVAQLLDGLAMLGFQHQGRATREGMLATAMALAPEALVAVSTLRGGACMLAHSITDDNGRNPFWAQYGYPGPQITPTRDEPYITPHVPADGEVIEADVVVVGSGAGGGTIAGVLATRGRRVVVLEAGGATSERDYRQLETEGKELMYRGGLSVSADGNVGLLAGCTLGGGTTVNWHNCVRPSDAVRREWAREHGLEGLDTAGFDRHLEAVLARMGANDRCSDFNGPHQRMAEGAKALGWSMHTAVRNVDEATYDPVAAGYTQFGDPSGSKRGTLNTYLRDAFDHGAKILVRTRAERVLTEGGRAAGVEAVYTDPAGGGTRRVTVRAADVVVACGALETPALLLRSGIGGPAVGHNLYLHPSAGIFGVYPEDQRAWWGPPQAAVMDEFRDLGDGYGLLVEGSQYYTGVFAFQLARRDGREAKEAMSKLGRMADFLFILRDHAGGRVTIDENGEAVHTYALTDERDVAAYYKGLRVLAELHLAAGAQELWFGATPPVFRRGDDFEAWMARLESTHIGAGGLFMGSAHQMGTARMGTDPLTSVAGPTGELHDVAGVWIGDTSAFPTPSGANPMLTCMALAHRTAEHIARHTTAA
ncbi:GMC family oxidoreductase [Planomonospora sp. ID67723]|uniref:GMC family oxidoreductase n=1 Tax=Planomonospora sp. ID67723 TaxID=2738134 RepID=UPI0018C38657|nr:GMC family oxidoreductase [Planomonospora sp. ID67723]MBG0829158.1 GMC family oxidoreductase [Planomonospora sp. ID67723]